ncbi:MAG: hypothetical protein ABIZ04_02200 [Opitutus sp.]
MAPSDRLKTKGRECERRGFNDLREEGVRYGVGSATGLFSVFTTRAPGWMLFAAEIHHGLGVPRHKGDKI